MVCCPLEWELGNLDLLFSFAIGYMMLDRPPTCYSNSYINLQKEEIRSVRVVPLPNQYSLVISNKIHAIGLGISTFFL